jgi:hypothetical protein
MGQISCRLVTYFKKNMYWVWKNIIRSEVDWRPKLSLISVEWPICIIPSAEVIALIIRPLLRFDVFSSKIVFPNFYIKLAFHQIILGRQTWSKCIKTWDLIHQLRLVTHFLRFSYHLLLPIIVAQFIKTKYKNSSPNIHL